MTAGRNSLVRGIIGEEYTAVALTERGYTILARNYHCPYGEIDIIAKKEGILAFVEVKTRSRNAWYSPAQAVTKSKQEKIILTAQWYLGEHPLDLQPRFDVAELYLDRTGEKIGSMRYLENAFETEA